MGFWSFYFLAKLGLYAAGLIDLNWWLNALFALALLWSPPAAFKRWRDLAAIPLAIALLWHDSHWPSPVRIVEEWHALTAFSAGYVIELLERVVSWQVVGALLLGAGLHAVLSRRLRLGAVAVVALLAVPLLPAPRAGGDAQLSMQEVARRAMTSETPGSAAAAAGTPGEGPVPEPPSKTVLGDAELNALLDTFYREERDKAVALPTAKEVSPKFDLVFLSICSLAWDDITNAGMSGAPFLRRFDLMFRQFNSAASYSGPAVLRLLHGSCGQGPQHTLYEAAPPACNLFSRLEQTGFEPALLLNHDGHFDNFAEQLRQQGGLGLKPVSNRGAPVAMHSFDGTPIYSDYELLERWWRNAPKGGAKAPRALMYNTISLHDGNRVAGYGSASSTQTWRPRAEKLFADFERFFELVEQGGRPTVVVLVPEHGAAIHGDAMQIPGLREYPTPRITHVPAGVALLGFGPKPAGQQPVYVDQVTSYTALVGVVSTLLRSPESPWATLAQLAPVIPPMRWVAENDQTIVLRESGHVYVRSRDQQWSRYASDR